MTQPDTSFGKLPTDYRRKMCEHCAFRKGSVEMSREDQKEYLVMQCLHKTFYCHVTMFQENAGESKWLDNFDSRRKRDGSPAVITDHQVCAGFMKFYGEDFGVDGKEIPLENHALADMMGGSGD